MKSGRFAKGQKVVLGLEEGAGSSVGPGFYRLVLVGSPSRRKPRGRGKRRWMMEDKLNGSAKPGSVLR